MQLQNDAMSDGKITSAEKKILYGFKEMIKDLEDIIITIAETSEIKPDSNNKDDIRKILDEVFQFILSHLMEEAKKKGEVNQGEFELLETISKKLEEYLASYISTSRL